MHTLAAHADMEVLSINELGLVQEESFTARTKWYDLGLMLKVPVNSLDSIRSQFEDKSEQLREMLKSWLKSTHKPSWVCLVNALRCRAVGEMKLAEDLEGKYCSFSQGIREKVLEELRVGPIECVHVCVCVSDYIQNIHCSLAA
jgi:hypothetical protein